ncbi:hypothetical protein CL634_10145 [bacterium]|nr:hypothetical protein [bacterium]
MIIGLGGLARSGKDTFFEHAFLYFKRKGISAKRFAFADELKKEINDTCISLYGISAFTNDEKEKEAIRPVLVAHGMIRRGSSNGLHWINKIKTKIKKNSEEGGVSIITDSRFENEIREINSIGGKSIHITREGNNPPNEEERENDPKVRELSLYKFHWKDFGNEANEYPEKMVFSFLDLAREKDKWMI